MVPSKYSKHYACIVPKSLSIPHQIMINNLFSDVCSDMPKSALDPKTLKFLKFVLILMTLKDCEGEGEGERVPSLPQGETLAELAKTLQCVQRFPELEDNQDELTDLITETRCQVCLFVCLCVCLHAIGLAFFYKDLIGASLSEPYTSC